MDALLKYIEGTFYVIGQRFPKLAIDEGCYPARVVRGAPMVLAI